MWGSPCYTKIPEVKEESKLALRGQKGHLIGLAWHGTYQILINRPGNCVITSQDIIFEELIPTQTVPLQGEIVEDLLDNPEATVQIGNPPLFLGCQSCIPTLQKSDDDPMACQVPNQIPVHNHLNDEDRHPS